jgi:hypothetical protein
MVNLAVKWRVSALKIETAEKREMRCHIEKKSISHVKRRLILWVIFIYKKYIHAWKQC